MGLGMGYGVARTCERLLAGDKPQRYKVLPTRGDSRIAPTATTVADRTPVGATMPAGLPMAGDKPQRYISPAPPLDSGFRRKDEVRSRNRHRLAKAA